MNELQTTSPISLIELAVQQNAPLDNLEKLMNLQERHEKNTAEKAFNKAFSEWQKKKPKIVKSRTAKIESQKSGYKFEYKFESLSEIQKQVDPIISELGLSYTFEQTASDGKIKVTCILKHELGHFITTSMEAGADTSGSKNAIQAIGSTRSYLKRYTLEDVLGISADEDDDGKNAPDISDVTKYKKYVEFTSLYLSKKDKLEKEVITTMERILINFEVLHFDKAITHLKSIK